MIALRKDKKGRPKVKRLDCPLSENLIKVLPHLLEEWIEIEPIFNREGMYYSPAAKSETSNSCWCEFNGKAYEYKYGYQGFFSKYSLADKTSVTEKVFLAIKQLMKEKYKLTEQMMEDYYGYIQHKQSLSSRLDRYSRMKNRRSPKTRSSNALHI